MATSSTQSVEQTLALNGGPACVVDKPASYLHGAQELGEEEAQAAAAAVRSKSLFRFGNKGDASACRRFETRFAQLTGVPHAMAVNSGTSALICGMIGVGVSSGDEVIVPGYTYIATAAAVLAARGVPVLAEIDDSLTLDPDDVEKKITPRTRAIVPVHMRGTPCRMDRIMEVARRHNLLVLEDCAQANGGSFKGQPLGSIGDAGAFSFQHYKIITTGEGGVYVSKDKSIFDRGACYHDSAYTFWKQRENELTIEPFLGENYRMTEMAGAVAEVQLGRRQAILARLRKIKCYLLTELADLELRWQTVPDPDGDCAVSAVFYAGTPEKAKWWASALRAEGMAAGTVFDEGIPDRHIYYHWDYVLAQRTPDRHGYPWRDPSRPCQVKYDARSCPQTLHWLQQSVALPLTQAMSDAHVESCVKALRKVHAHAVK